MTHGEKFRLGCAGNGPNSWISRSSTLCGKIVNSDDTTWVNPAFFYQIECKKCKKIAEAGIK